MDRAQKQGRLRWALYNGSNETIVHLLADEPDLADGQVPLLVALYDVAAMHKILAQDANAATREYPPRRPMCHLAFSKYIKTALEKEPEMLAMAELLVEHGADPNEGINPHPSGEPSLVMPALHQAARRLASGEIARHLLEHGANPSAVSRGHSPYAFARIFGNREVASVLECAGVSTQLTSTEEQLARAADATSKEDDQIHMSNLSQEMRFLLCRLVWREGTLPHMHRLVEIGVDPNLPDEMGMPPLHLAGWEGMPDVMSYFLNQNPDLNHTNAYGGTLLSTIVHGSENCPQKAHRHHIECARLTLETGVALPRKASQFATVPKMSAFLADWAESHPRQVTEHGVV